MVETNTATFLAGRDLAVALLTERETPVRTRGRCWEDLSSIEAEYRDGEPQNNWVLAYVQRVIAAPELAEGFSAVMSDFMSNIATDAAAYEGLTIEEMRPGARHA